MGSILGWESFSMQVSFKSVRSFLWYPADKPANEMKQNLLQDCEQEV